MLVNAWEQASEAQALNALAGSSTTEEVLEDRKRRAAEVISMLTITPEKIGFEIGSGTGLVAKRLAPHCARLDCSDISQSFLAMATKECAGYSNIHFHRITDRYLDHLPSEQYDFGYASTSSFTSIRMTFSTICSTSGGC